MLEQTTKRGKTNIKRALVHREFGAICTVAVSKRKRAGERESKKKTVGHKNPKRQQTTKNQEKARNCTQIATATTVVSFAHLCKAESE